MEKKDILLDNTEYEIVIQIGPYLIHCPFSISLEKVPPDAML